MLTTVESLFNQISKISKKNRQNNISFDGKQFWQPIKDILSTSDWKAVKWKMQSKKRYGVIMEMPEFIINGYGETKIIEKNHFLIQTARIPHNEEPSIKKICQVALNIGQYEGYTKETIENNDIKFFLLKSDSTTKLENFFPRKSIKQLEKLLKD